MALPDIDSLWDYSDPEVSEGRFLEHLAPAEEAGDPVYLGVLLTQLARSQGLQRKFDQAWSTLDGAERVIGDNGGIPHVRLLLERGRVKNSSGDQDAARPYFLKAFEMANSAGSDFFAVDAAHMMGIIEPGEKGIEWNNEALKIAETSIDEKTRRWRGPLYNNTGWTLHDMGEYERALDLFERNVEWHQSIGSGEPLRIAKWSVARVMRSLGRWQEALARQHELREEMERLGLANDGYVSEEIGELLLALGREDEATPWFAKAHQVLSNDLWLQAKEKERLERLARLGGLQG